MSEPALRPEKDFSKETDKQIADSEKLAKVSKDGPGGRGPD